jgi:dimethylhistidine N-methyltransferase
MNQFLQDVLKGLSAKEKYLESKYFYDAKGDVLFQKIMACEEYYPTDCEMEIFTDKTQELVSTLQQENQEFDIVELGAGDATKSIHLLKGLLDNKVNFTYYPVDISQNVIQQLHTSLPSKLPEIKVHGLNGEYFNMLNQARTLSSKIKVVLFLGGNIGNVPYEKAEAFCKELRSNLSEGDMVLIGFDLKKDPATILAAYNDKGGYTRDFNLNLLHRINAELKGDFNPSDFYHYPTYDPATGTCKSYLVSTKQQQVTIGEKVFDFKEGEPIHTEISQKYTADQTDDLCAKTGCKTVKHFYDSKGWFLDSIWQCI